MQATTLEKSNFAQSAVVSIATAAALALLGLVLAYWTWAFVAPRSEPGAQVSQAGPSDAVAARAATSLFGSRKRDLNGPASAGSAVSLLGVVAASDNRPGYAILRLDAKQTVAVQEGADVEPGVRLAQVRAGSVILERNGIQETLALQVRGAAAAGAAPRK